MHLEIDAEELEIAFEISIEFANEYLATNPTTVLTQAYLVVLRIYTYEMTVGKQVYAVLNETLRFRGAQRLAQLAPFKKYLWMLLKALSNIIRSYQTILLVIVHWISTFLHHVE